MASCTGTWGQLQQGLQSMTTVDTQWTAQWLLLYAELYLGLQAGAHTQTATVLLSPCEDQAAVT